MDNINNDINALLQQVEHVFGRKPQGPSDFDALVASIFTITHQHIGTSTLKRIWGYVHTATSPRTSTLDVLSLYVGYASYSAFCDSQNGTDKTIESNPVLGMHIDGHEIFEGKEIKVIWQPDRQCIFRSLGNARFVVVESHNSKLSVGDTFTCKTLLNGAPLYLTDLIMKGSTIPVCYVCGRENGVTIIE